MSTLKTNNIQHVDRSDPSIIISTDGGVSIAGTLTYEDVTSVDAVGIVTAREILNAQKQVHVGTGVSVKAGGLNVTAGITTVQALQATTISGTTGTFSGDVSITDTIVHTGDTNTKIRFPSNDTITFETSGDEMVRISNVGHVGINTTNPVQELTIFGDSPNFRMTHSGNTNQKNSAYVHVDETGMEFNSYQEVTATRRPIIFKQYTDERLRIDGNGRLIIGHTASTGEARFFQIVGTSADTASAQLIRHSADSSSSQIDLTKSRNATKGSNTIVQDDDVLGQITFRGDDGTDLNSTGATISAAVDGTPGANDMPGRLVFATTADGSNSATERMRIDSSGRVMVGSTQYIGGAALAVLGTSDTPNTYGSFAIARVGANPTSGTVLANIRLNGGAVGTRRGAEINAYADANWTDGSSHPTYLTFGTVASGATGATERMRIHAGGNVDIKTGNLVISTSGKGIDFAATSDGTGTDSSELFDDYEEGSFTPYIDRENGSPIVGYDAQDGYYTKIGKVVYFYAEVRINSYNGNGSYGLTHLRGLPYQSATRTGGRGVWNSVTYHSYYRDMTTTDGEKDIAVVQHTSEKVVFYIQRSENSWATTPAPDANDQFKIGGFYFT